MTVAALAAAWLLLSSVVAEGGGHPGAPPERPRLTLGVSEATPTPDWSILGEVPQTYYGADIESAGDVNRDFRDEVLVVAPSYYSGSLDELGEGKAYLYMGTASGPATTPAWSFESNQLGGHLTSARSAGDVDGDGYGDVMVAAQDYDNGEADEGLVWLFFGSPSGLSPAPGWSTEGNQAGARYGVSTCAGDVNGDGYADVIIGAYLFEAGQLAEGRAFLYLGGPGGPASSPDWTAESNRQSTYFGAACSTGDVNGDGFDEIAIGASGYSNRQTNEGAVYLYRGSAIGPEPSPWKILAINKNYAGFGASVSIRGDFNGDGYHDLVSHVLIGDVHQVYIFNASANGFSS